ncbi:antibiotic biosynthesis monooxygenase [Kineococcus rhizosphaerae]|uniref:Antibiotic biosynthesis monooxygenase n=1 Tax=Kineococcus rhizosphaerae TaxID=559628 RepID=A0A2T0RBE5_9ACTN|nr:antibiotic biosynthesis monooxygenase [Kineococcus rhizosphaerae]
MRRVTVIAILELTLKTDSLEQAPAIITETLEATRAFAGNLGCEVTFDVTDETHVAIVERWESLEADDAYRAFRATPEGANRLGSITADRKLTRYTVHDDL